MSKIETIQLILNFMVFMNSIMIMFMEYDIRKMRKERESDVQ